MRQTRPWMNRAARLVALFVALIAGGWAFVAHTQSRGHPHPDLARRVALGLPRARQGAESAGARRPRRPRGGADPVVSVTSTFPNHYTIVTGLYPDHHGIVSNTIVDPTIGPDRFTLPAPTAKIPRWWGGEPIWTTAIRQGLKSASMFWPGSEAVHPTYWKPYDDAFPNADRVKQVLDWMALPEAERPSFITLYFSDVDSAAHRSGPELRRGARGRGASGRDDRPSGVRADAGGRARPHDARRRVGPRAGRDQHRPADPARRLRQPQRRRGD